MFVSQRLLCAFAFPAAIGMFGIPASAAAQTQEGKVAAVALPDLVDGKRIFLPAYFASDNPQTAADMVNRVPGFDIQNGDNNVRGFGGAAGNVLIDGARPTSKSDNLREILARIPSASVERIELLEGAAAGALAPGKTQVVNVIRKADAKSGGSWEVKAKGISSGFILPSLEASYTARLGRFNVTAGIEAAYESAENFIGFEGFIDPSGSFTERGPNDDRRRNRFGKASLGADGSFGAYKLSLNGSWVQAGGGRRWSHIATLTGATLPYRVDEGRDVGDFTEWEIGGDIERDIAGWTGKLALLTKTTDETRGDLAGFNLIGAPKSFGRFNSASEGRENVVATTLKRKFGAHQIEFGAEYAFNSLDFSGAFAQGNGDVFVVQPGDISQTEVQEVRYETFVSDSWTISDKLTLDATVTAEWSTISQTGDAAKERSFFYPKPRLKAVWKPVAGWTYRASVERDLGQLDFGAFADSASVGDGNQNSGNPELRPEQEWVYRTSLEKRWGNRGIVDIGIVYRQIEDKLTLVPTRNGGVALGNIPEASLWGYNVSFTIPLDALVKGLEIESSYRWRDSELLDPLTGQVRPFYGPATRQFSGNIRYDLPARKLKMGAWYWRGGANRDYRPTQDFEWPASANWGAWIETSAVKELLIEFGVENPNGFTVSRIRRDYAPDRRSGQLARTQIRERSQDGQWYVSVKGKF
jgi:TonB-dependent Receptor Plug Domain